jgi:hypothetical protein
MTKRIQTANLDGTAPISLLPTIESLSGQLWRASAPNEVDFFSALVWSIADATASVIDRLTASDFKHPTSALIYDAAQEVRARGKDINEDTLHAECKRRSDVSSGRDAADWENAADALDTLRAPRSDADKLAVSLADKIAPPLRFSFATLADVMTRPDPKFLIHRVLTLGGTSLLTAKHASFKSFIALDMALSVATGRAWHGFNVRRGSVVYVAAEGSTGIKKRARAWLDFHDEQTPDNFIVLDVPLQIADEATRAAFIAEVSALEPSLIILDTLARCAVGLEENSSKDMGAFADALGKLASATGAHVMTVHHNNKGGEYRGSTAVPAAVDTHLTLERKGDTVTLEMPKQKDADEIEPICFEKREVSIPGTRGQTHSIVFEKLDSSEGRGLSLSDDEQRILDALIETHSDDGAPSGEWHKCCEPMPSRATFQRARKRLLELKFVSTPNPDAHTSRYYPTDPNAPDRTETDDDETPENSAKVVSNSRETIGISDSETTTPKSPVVSEANETT